MKKLLEIRGDTVDSCRDIVIDGMPCVLDSVFLDTRAFENRVMLVVEDPRGSKRFTSPLEVTLPIELLASIVKHAQGEAGEFHRGTS